MPRQPTATGRVLLALVVTAALVPAACSSPKKSSSTAPASAATLATVASTTTTSTVPRTTVATTTSTTVAATTTTAPATTTTVAATPVYPITGLPITDPAAAARQTLVVKIDNSRPARPQSGLNEADMVFEEIVNDSLTRFALVYQSMGDNVVGPARSGRIQDIDLMGMFNHPLFALVGRQRHRHRRDPGERPRRHRSEPRLGVLPVRGSVGPPQPVQLHRGAVDADDGRRRAAAADLAVPPRGRGAAGLTQRRRRRAARQRRRRLAVGRHQGPLPAHHRRPAAQRRPQRAGVHRQRRRPGGGVLAGHLRQPGRPDDRQR